MAVETFAVGDEVDRLVQWAEAMLPNIEHGLTTRPGSKLAKTNELADPARIDTFVASDLLSVVEHVVALAATLERGGVYPRALFTLLRPAIEASAASRWLLTPTSRDERARRSLLRAAASFREDVRVRKLLLAEPAPPERETAMRGGLARLGLPTEGKALTTALEEVRSGRILTATEDGGFGPTRTLIWKLASGMTHGELYALIALAQRTGRDDRGLSSLAANSDVIDSICACVGLDASYALAEVTEQGAVWQDPAAVAFAIGLFREKELAARRRAGVFPATRVR